MREYTLNDIGFTPGKVEELPINFSVENTMNTDEINEQSQKNRQMGEELLRQFEERQKAEVVADVVMETTTKNDVKDRYFTCRSFLVLKGYSLLKKHLIFSIILT